MNTIQPGQVLTARSMCDYDCVYTCQILDRKGSFVTCKPEGRDICRVKVRNDSYGEFIFAMGRHSMAPIFRAHGLGYTLYPVKEAKDHKIL